MNTGGPAFPIHGTGMFHEPSTNTQGMTLLDWMAGQALAGLYGTANEQSYKLSREGHPSLKREDVAKDCYSMASAMLAEKARREEDHPEDKLGKDHSPNAGKVVEINRELVEALTNMLARDKRNTCQHEETHRGGVLWEICDNCKASWADDQGGKPPWSDPPEWIAAEAAIAKAKGVA